MAIVTEVKRLKIITVLAMLALWLPATNHCRLEQILSLAFLTCSDHEDTGPHQDSDCDNDGCALVESGFYKTEDGNIDPVLPLSGAVFVPELVPPTEQSPPLFVNFSTVASPELPGTWQFSFRTALPPRAPSLVS